MSTDPRIDSYIENSAAFAQPILVHLREIVHQACPDVGETMKWSFPHFDHNGILCSMAAFKKHCSFGFWKATIMKDSKQLLTIAGNTDMGRFDNITSLKDLPHDKILIAYIKEAVRINEEGIKLPTKIKNPQKAEIPMPADLSAALKKNKKANVTFEEFSPSNKREYLEWITGAKSDDTRKKRVDTTIEWLTEGKNLHWKYQK